MFFNAFGCICTILHCIGSVFQCIHCIYSIFQCILIYFNIFEYIYIYIYSLFECIHSVAEPKYFYEPLLLIFWINLELFPRSRGSSLFINNSVLGVK
jgi:hypothetical protein